MRPSSALAFSPGAAGPLLRPGTPWDWTLLADCQYTDPEVFFPEPGGDTVAARRVCAGCPVRAQCLAYAAENGEHGIWGGLSEEERSGVPRAAPALSPYFACGRHRRTPDGTGADGRCLGCRRESDADRRAARTGTPVPQSGRISENRDRDRSGRFAPAQHGRRLAA
jgi:hypothetical protein